MTSWSNQWIGSVQTAWLVWLLILLWTKRFGKCFFCHLLIWIFGSNHYSFSMMGTFRKKASWPCASSQCSVRTQCLQRLFESGIQFGRIDIHRRSRQRRRSKKHTTYTQMISKRNVSNGVEWSVRSPHTNEYAFNWIGEREAFQQTKQSYYY